MAFGYHQSCEETSEAGPFLIACRPKMRDDEASTSQSSTTISPDEVRRIADLAHLDLSEAEIESMVAELGAILDYVRQLDEVDTEGAAPMDHGCDAALPLRADEPRPSLAQEMALREAPRSGSDGFAVPAFVDEG